MGRKYGGFLRARVVIGFAVAGSALPFGTPYLGDGDAISAQVPRQAGAVMAGAFDTDGNELPQRVGPGHEAAVTGSRGRQTVGAQWSTQLVDGMGDVELLVRIDTDDDL
jgi:hypothetical protein